MHLRWPYTNRTERGVNCKWAQCAVFVQKTEFCDHCRKKCDHKWIDAG